MISTVKPVVDDSEEHGEWYKTWFNSPYYHILYKNRDYSEAEFFLDSLIDYLKPKSDSRILDVACGKGRHSIYLNKKGFDVSGFDLSENNILYDKKFENENLKFYLHDMREVFRVNYFDIVLNLFSSFGYFDKERDNLRCLISDAIALKPDGVFIFDYFNSTRVKHIGNQEVEKNIQGINFHIRKKVEDKIIRKDISFTDKGHNFFFEETLLLIEKNEFEKLFDQAGLKIINCFGDYKLGKFDSENSDRLILIANKKI